MNSLKISALIFFALFIDAFTFFVGLALSIIAAAPGTFGGCAVGAAVAGKAGCAVLGLLGSIPIINGALAVITEPIGIMLGIAISISINLTFGTILIGFLKFADIFDGKVVIGCLIGEALPGFNMLPLWTGMVFGCVRKHAQTGEYGAALGIAASLSKGFSLSNISKINPAIGGALQQGQREGAGQIRARFSSGEQKQLDDSTRQAAAESNMNLKASVARLKTSINGDIAPKTAPSYGQEIPA